MSFLADPVSAATETLKHIPSASKKGPDPERFVTRLPEHPGKRAVTAAFKRKHNIWKWRNYKPDLVPRKEKTLALKKKPVKKLESLEELPEEDGEQDADKGDVKLPPLSSSKEGSLAAIEKARESSKSDGDSFFTESHVEDEMPFFGHECDDEAEAEAKRLANMSPEQKVYHRVCEYYKVKPWRQVMKQLETPELNLSHVMFRDIDLKSIMAGIVMNYNVRRLILSDTFLTEQQMTYVTDFLEDDNAVTDLTICDNHLEGRVLNRMIEAIQLHDAVVFLDISGNNLRDKDIPVIASYLETSSALDYLYMARNKFSVSGAEALGKALGNSSLQHISVSGNQFRGAGMVSLLNGLAKCNNLERIDVSWNGIGPEAIKALVNLVKTSRNLIWLSITATRINGECLDLLTTQGLAKNTILQRLDMKNNPLTTNDIDTFLSRLVALPMSGLRRIDFSDFQAMTETGAHLAEKLLSDRDVDIRCGPVLAHSRKIESVWHVIDRHKKDATSLVERLTPDERATVMKSFADRDMAIVLESGDEIVNTSFLGRYRENMVTHADLVRRIAREDGYPKDVVKEVLQYGTPSQKMRVRKFTVNASTWRARLSAVPSTLFR